MIYKLPHSPAAYQLLHEGALAMADIEAAGIRVDVPYIQRTMVDLEGQIKALTAELRNDDVYKLWRKTYGAEINLDSRPQLAHVLFNLMGLSAPGFTRGGRVKADAEALKNVDLPFARKYIAAAQLKKLHGTYLKGILRETVDGILRPSFNLHRMITYRSSSSDPNFQNIPIRSKIGARYIRTAFIPRDGYKLLEIDLKANEVRVACCYCRDEKLIYDTLHGDMHRDMSAECYFLPQDKVPKAVRNTTKGSFVFAEFFGSDYINVAPSLWVQIGKQGLVNAAGTPLYDHLALCGIDGLGLCDRSVAPVPGTYEHHIKEVEDDFWQTRYRAYNQWRHELWAQYKVDGWLQMETGFIYQGIHSKNEVINAPIQGSAFHCLLWLVIELNKWLKANKMRTLIVGQIHDSIELDVYASELPDVMAKIHQLMTVDIRKAWPWLIVPLEGEAEIAEANWYEKVPIDWATAV